MTKDQQILERLGQMTKSQRQAEVSSTIKANTMSGGREESFEAIATQIGENRALEMVRIMEYSITEAMTNMEEPSMTWIQMIAVENLEDVLMEWAEYQTDLSLVAEVLANETYLVDIVLNWISDVVESLSERYTPTDEKAGKADFLHVKSDDVEALVKEERDIFVRKEKT